jgi:hypothetical protein
VAGELCRPLCGNPSLEALTCALGRIDDVERGQSGGSQANLIFEADLRGKEVRERRRGEEPQPVLSVISY